jgi:NAD+ synthase
MRKNNEFDPAKQVLEIERFIKDYFVQNGTPTTKAVIGISGGKDSTVAAALLVRALGPDRVIGVMMPNGYQNDIEDSKKVCEILGIQNYLIDIGDPLAALYNRLLPIAADAENPLPPIVTTNTPARMRMATLYAIAGLVGGRVCNTGNASEAFIGYTTKYGDLAGDFALLKNLTVREVYAIGDYLELPMLLVHKHPADGMSGKTDEDNTGIPYDAIDDYLLNDVYPEQAIYEKMMAAHKRNLHKRVIDLPAPRRTCGYLRQTGEYGNDFSF